MRGCLAKRPMACKVPTNQRRKRSGWLTLSHRMAHPHMLWMPVSYPGSSFPATAGWPPYPGWPLGQQYGAQQPAPMMEQAQSWSSSPSGRGKGWKGAGQGKAGVAKGVGLGKSPQDKGGKKGGGNSRWGGRGRGKGENNWRGEKREREGQAGSEQGGGDQKVKFQVTFRTEGLGQRFDRWLREEAEGRTERDGRGDQGSGPAAGEAGSQAFGGGATVRHEGVGDGDDDGDGENEATQLLLE